ncbi:MAG: DUF1848 domain-containing protein [Aristaeellaceae bacterium]
MIIHTGLRTDIPAFYAPWLLNRLREGYVLVRNPFHPSSVTRYTLSPEVVDLIAFCTKNPRPMLPHLDALRSYGQYWFVTITPYGRELEPHVPPREQVMADFRALSKAVGPQAMGWRYDPILLWGEWTVEKHLAAFAEMAAALEGATDTCVISFIDLYKKVRRNFSEAREVSREDRLHLGAAMAEIARRHGMTLKACAEGDELAPYGVDCSGCMTIATYERALGCRLRAPRVASNRQGQCACHLTCDIGAYNSCGHFCRYCYANENPAIVRETMRRHDPASPFLIGGSMPGDVIHTPRQTSWRDGQLAMDGLM